MFCHEFPCDTQFRLLFPIAAVLLALMPLWRSLRTTIGRGDDASLHQS